MIRLVRLRPGKRDRFVTALQHIAEASLREAGCRRFDLIEDPGDSARFTLYELYSDAAALEIHRMAAHHREFERVLKTCATEDELLLGRTVPPANATTLERPLVVHAANAPTVARGGGVSTSYLATESLGANSFMTGTTEFPVNASIAMHSHDCQESVVILEGAALFESAEGTVELSVGDATLVPAVTPHRFLNGGSDTMRILWIYGRRDPSRTFSETGQTVRIRPPG